MPDTLKRVVPRERWILIGSMFLTFFLMCLFLDVAFASVGEVGIWPFDMDYADDSGNANNWETMYYTYIIPGVIGNATLFNGTNPYLDQRSRATLNSTCQDGFSIVMWLNVSKRLIGTEAHLVGNRKDGTQEGIRTLITSNGYLYMLFEGLTDEDLTGTTNLTAEYPEEWIHVIFVYNTTHKIIFIDGEVEAIDSATGTLAVSPYNWSIARKPETGGSQFYGMIDELQIINSSAPENHLIVKGYYEANASPMTFDLRVLNSTTWTEYEDVTPWFINWTEYLATGSVELQVSQGSAYPTRHYYMNLYTSESQEIYLLSSSSGAYVRFHVQNNAGVPLASALVTAQKQYGTEWKTIDQGRTDDTGTATLFLNPTDTYKIIISYAGYVGQELTITPSSPDYTITLVSSTDLHYSNLFDDISYQLVPLTLAVDSTGWINFSVYSFNSSLEYWGLNLTYTNGTCINCQISDASGGGELDGTFSLSGVSSITAYYYFKRTGYSEWANQRNYIVHNITAGQFSLFNIFNVNMSDADFIPPFVRDMSVLAVITLVSLPFGAVSPMGAGFIALIGLGFTTIMGWFSANLFMLLLLALGSVVVLAGLGK